MGLGRQVRCGSQVALVSVGIVTSSWTGGLQDTELSKQQLQWFWSHVLPPVPGPTLFPHSSQGCCLEGGPGHLQPTVTVRPGAFLEAGEMQDPRTAHSDMPVQGQD